MNVLLLSIKKTSIICSKNKKELKIIAQRNVYGQLLMTSQEHSIDLEKLFSYPLGPVPWSLATGDGRPEKTDKAVLLHK